MQSPSSRVRAGGAVALALALSLGAAAACAGPDQSAGPGDDISLVVVSGNNQSAPAGTELPQPLVVRATNSAGTAIANQIINFRVVAGGGAVFAGTAKTNSSGYAREWWTLGPNAGLNRVEARAVNPGTAERQVFGVFDATGTTGGGGTPTPVLTSVVVTPDSSNIQVGQTVQLSAALRDQNGATMSGTVTWSTLNASIATVSGSGLVTGAAAGTARIVGASGGRADTAKVVVTATTPPPPSSSGRWISGYYPGYQRSLYPETQVDFSVMTHVMVGAVQPTANGGVTRDFYIDNTNGPLMARNLSARAHQFGRKAILMLGGAGSRDLLVSATSSANRATFVANLIRTMDDLGYDGIDVDWEPVEDSDKPQLLQLLRDLRAARPGMLITFPVMWTNANFPADAWYAQVAPLVDQLNIMSYGMADNWGGWVSWHHAALYGEASNRPSSVASSVRAYVAAGVPASKLGIGLSSYGSCWRGASTMLQTLGSTAGVVASDNEMSYANIMSQYHTSSAYRWDATARAGYLSFATQTGPQGCTMVSYEDVQSITEKGAYVKSAGLGGAIMWTVQQGYLPSAPAGQQNPLLTAAYNSIVP